MEPVQIRICNKCGKSKELISQNWHKRSDGVGYRTICKECYASGRRLYYANTSDHWKEYLRNKYATDADHRAKVYDSLYRRKTVRYEWDRKAIAAIYEQSRTLTLETGIRHEVDHEIPINGENVCGLHVSWNLRITTMSENRAKKNHQ